MDDNKWFLSSSGDGDLGLTIKGALTALIPLIIVAAKSFHLNLAEGDIQNWIVALTTLLSAILVVVGLARKLWNGRLHG